MPFYDQYGNELIGVGGVTAAGSPLGLPVAAQTPGGTSRRLGRVQQDRRVQSYLMFSTAVDGKGGLGSPVNSSQILLDWANELLIYPYLTVTGSVTAPTSPQLQLQTLDPTSGGWVNLVAAIALLANTSSGLLLAVPQAVSTFGDYLRVVLSAGVPWGGSGTASVQCYLKAKG